MKEERFDLAAPEALDPREEEVFAEALTMLAMALPRPKSSPLGLALVKARLAEQRQRRRWRRARAWAWTGWAAAATVALLMVLPETVLPWNPLRKHAQAGERRTEDEGAKPEVTTQEQGNAAKDIGSGAKDNGPAIGRKPAVLHLLQQGDPESTAQLRERLAKLQANETARYVPSADLARLVVVELHDPAKGTGTARTTQPLAERMLALLARDLALAMESPGATAIPTIPEEGRGDPPAVDAGAAMPGPPLDPAAVAAWPAPGLVANPETLLAFDETAGTGLLMFRGLPQPEPGEVYQLWIEDPQTGALTSPGLLPGLKDQNGLISFSLGQGGPAPSSYLITRELPGGAALPGAAVVRRWPEQ